MKLVCVFVRIVLPEHVVDDLVVVFVPGVVLEKFYDILTVLVQGWVLRYTDKVTGLLVQVFDASGVRLAARLQVEGYGLVRFVEVWHPGGYFLFITLFGALAELALLSSTSCATFWLLRRRSVDKRYNNVPLLVLSLLRLSRVFARLRSVAARVDRDHELIFDWCRS